MRCLSQETKKLTTVNSSDITKVFSAEKSRILLKTFFDSMKTKPAEDQ